MGRYGPHNRAWSSSESAKVMHMASTVTMFLHLSLLTSILTVVCGFQVPFVMPTSHISEVNVTFKQGPDVLSPRDMLELPRPGSGVANAAGDLAFVSISKHSFGDKKGAILLPCSEF